MSRPPLGCLSTSGLLAALLTALALAVAGAIGGGAMFSPGRLSALVSTPQVDRLPGEARTHADLERRCAACHPAPWSKDTMADRCLGCHTEVADEMLRRGSLHALLLAANTAADCGGCHPEHRGAAAALTVVDAANFPHDATGYSLTGHATTARGEPFACGDCHSSALFVFDRGRCESCHTEMDAAYVQDHVAMFGNDCLGCHDGIDTYGSDFDHDVLAFALNGKHETVDCGGCHVMARSIADLRAAPQACVECHRDDDAHEGKFGTDCAGCHTADDWQQATFDHARTSFPLTGKHIDVPCGECHTGNTFAGTPQQCVECHHDPAFHAGLFREACDRCHTTAGWSPARFELPHTFPVDHGQGGVSSCRTCHPDALSGYTCYGCHEHNPAEIAAKHQEEGIADFADCMACHPTGQEDEAEGGGREGGGREDD